jgi:hypothetical protein
MLASTLMVARPVLLKPLVLLLLLVKLLAHVTNVTLEMVSRVH